MSCAWTLGDRLSRVVYPGGAAVVYSRDATGHIATVTRRVGGVDTVLVEDTDYAPFGPLTRVDFGGGQHLQFAYDKNYGIDEVSGAGLSLDFELDAVGNLTHLLTLSDERAYGYDALSRLTRVDDENAQALEAFTYDATGNRLTKGNGTGTQTYAYPPASHRLSSVAGIGRSYDAMGSLIDRGDGWSFEYNDAARLSQARLNGTPRMSARYSGRGERVAKTDSSTGEVSYFLYDEGGRLLAEYLDTASAPQREYLWLDDRLVGVFVNAGNYAGSLLRVASDHLGTPRALVGAGGSVMWRHPLEGAVFGEDLAQQDPDGDGQPLVFNLRFPGQYFDGETGLHYNYFRDYEPGTGRYVESDPIGLDGGLNTYAYVFGNPLGWTDEVGLQSVMACASPANAAACAAAGIGPSAGTGSAGVVAAGSGAATAGSAGAAAAGGAATAGALMVPHDSSNARSRTIPWPAVQRGKWTCTCRADCNDNIPGNCPEDPNARFAFGTASHPNYAVARKEAKRAATESLGCQPKHVPCRCAGPSGEQINSQ